MRPVALLSGAALMAVALVACGPKTSAVAPRDLGANPPSSGPAATASTDGGQARVQDPRDLPIPQIDGKPLWAPNRKHTAEENAEYQFSKNGGDFGAKSESDYVTRVHAFIENPPHDVETLDRPNGDKLMYDAKDNTFAVVARNGAPRTMFKPRDGASYWAQQKERESKRASDSQGAASGQT